VRISIFSLFQFSFLRYSFPSPLRAGGCDSIAICALPKGNAPVSSQCCCMCERDRERERERERFCIYLYLQHKANA
jgi:hypothetical protein